MARRREEIDLELALSDPARAREYILSFDWGLDKRPRYVVFGPDQKINLDAMTDSEAISAAYIILKDIEIKRAQTEANLEKYGH